MPQRTRAHRRQREFFADLSDLDDLVLTTKNGEPCALNIHGSFELVDKHWAQAEYPKDETMLALVEPRPHRAQAKEPRVHFHVDWDKVTYARIQPRRLELIHSDYEIVFCTERDQGTRIFWFYLRDSFALQSLRAKWGDEWIDLQKEKRYSPLVTENEHTEYARA